MAVDVKAVGDTADSHAERLDAGVTSAAALDCYRVGDFDGVMQRAEILRANSVTMAEGLVLTGMARDARGQSAAVELSTAANLLSYPDHPSQLSASFMPAIRALREHGRHPYCGEYAGYIESHVAARQAAAGA